MQDNQELEACCSVEESKPITVSAHSDPSMTLDATIGPQIQFLEKDQVVDILFRNAATPGNELGFFGAFHPMHLHGHYVWVLGEGEDAFDASSASGQLNFEDPPFRDMFVVLADSWSLVGLKATTNPGLWFLHCHSEMHAVFGMSTTLVVGDEDERPSLPEGFPVCGSVSGNESSAQAQCVSLFVLVASVLATIIVW